MNALDVRPDLVEAQEAAWASVTGPGASWSGEQRAAIAAVALAALDDSAPVAPWVAPSAAGRLLPGADVLGDEVADAVYRVARHAGTLTREWYEARLDAGMTPAAYIELVAVVCIVAAVDGFHRALALPTPPLPPTVDGVARGGVPELVPATLNWVPVVPPADENAAVVQGLSGAPDDFAIVRRLAAAQYIPFDEMGDLAWNRGTLTRADMEIVASRLARGRECFY